MMNSKGRLKLLLLIAVVGVILISASPVSQDASKSERTHGLRESEQEMVKEYVNTIIKSGQATDPQALKDQIGQMFNSNFSSLQPSSAVGPSLECAYYNHDDCLSKGACNITKETCSPQTHLVNAGCYAIWNYPIPVNETNSTDLFIPVARSQYRILGCLQFQDHDLMGCSEHSDCQQTIDKKGVGHCCCSTPNCNGAVLLQANPLFRKEDPTTTTMSYEGIPVQSTSGLDLSLIILFLIAVLGMLLLVAVICAGFQTIKYKLKQKRERMKRLISNDEKSTLLENGNVNGNGNGNANGNGIANANVIRNGNSNSNGTVHTPVVHPMVQPIEEIKPDEKKKPVEIIEMVETPKIEKKDLPITNFQLISQGRFGKVYKAIYKGPDGKEKEVAVKKMHENQRKCYEAEKMIFELFKTYPKWYACVVGYTCAEKIGNEYWIVTDFHGRLSLYEFLRHNPISIASCGRLIISMLDGLQYLHDDRSFFEDYPKKPIIHRDIKSKNILVKSDMTACIADFGLARIYDNDHVKCDILAQVGTRRYMSPEMMEAAVDLSPTGFKAMDVYSMALVMWETISRTILNKTDEVPEHHPPYYEIGPDPKVNEMRRYITVEKQRPTFRPEVAENEHTREFMKTTEEMWHHEASARITAGCALERIWRVYMSNPPIPKPPSEGYFTESSEESIQSVKAMERCLVDTSRLRKYHNHEDPPGHPTPDPNLFNIPPVPDYPKVTDRGIIHKPGTEPVIQQEDEVDVRPEKQVYYLEFGRFATKEELIRLRKEAEEAAAAEAEACNTRASTPTPSSTFY